jgi:hypothetical protein
MYSSNRTTKLCKFLSKQRKQATSKLVFLSQSPQAGRLLLAQEGPLRQFAKILKAKTARQAGKAWRKQIINTWYMLKLKFKSAEIIAVYAEVELYKEN